MAIWNVEAYDSQGASRKLEVNQPSKEAVIDFLHRQGFTPISIHEKKKAGLPFLKKLPGVGAKRVPLIEKVTFAQHMAMLIKVGVPLFEAMEIVQEGIKNPRLREVISAMIEGLEQGKTFSSVFDRFPDVFDPVFVGMVKVGEASGTLDKSFEIIVDRLQKDRELQKNIRGAMIYPIVIMVLIFLVAIGILLFIIPRLSTLFAQSKIKLGFATQVMFGLSSFINKNPLLFFIGMLIIGGALFAFSRSAAGRKRFVWFFNRLPVLKKLLQMIYLARFSRTMASLSKGGLQLVESLDITRNIMGDTPYGEPLKAVEDDLVKGVALSAGMKKHAQYFPLLMTGIITVGEKTANLDVVFEHLANFYEDEVDSVLKTLVTLIEPVMLLILGGIVTVTALSVIVPIYSLITSLGQ